LLIGAVLAHGVPAVFALLAAAMTGVAAIIAVLGPRTNRVTLEELSGRSRKAKSGGSVAGQSYRDGAQQCLPAAGWLRPTGGVC